MATFDDARRTALGVLADTSTALQRHGDEAGATTVRDARNQLLDGRLTAAVVGEFKRGKSSLIGALVEDTALFPVNVDIATSLITSVEYAAEEQITVFVGPPGSSTPVWISREQIADFVTEQGNPGNAKAARLVRIQTPNPRLRDGLVLMDTPGAGGLNTQHTAITFAVLGNADVAIFVVDALTPMTVEELTMLETTVRLGARLLLVITKIDKVVDHAGAISNARNKLVGVLGPEIGESVPIIAVSSTAKLDWLRSHDPDDLADSNFEALDAALWGLLSERGGGLLLGRALSRTIGSLDARITPLRAELVGLTADDDEIRSAVDTVQLERDHLAALAEPGAGWRATLVDAFGAIRARTADELVGRLAVITKDLDTRLAAGPKAQHEEAIISGLERDVTVAWTELVHQARAGIATLSDDVEALTGLSVNPGLAFAGRLTAFDSFGRRRPSKDDDSAMSGLQAVGLIGEVISWIGGLGPLYLISQVVSIFGISTAKTSKRRAEFESNVRDQLGRAERELQDRMTELFDSAENSVTTSYERMIRDRHGAMNAADRALRAGPGEATRTVQVRQSLAELSALRDSAAQLADQVSTSAVRAAAI